MMQNARILFQIMILSICFLMSCSTNEEPKLVEELVTDSSTDDSENPFTPTETGENLITDPLPDPNGDESTDQLAGGTNDLLTVPMEGETPLMVPNDDVDPTEGTTPVTENNTLTAGSARVFYVINSGTTVYAAPDQASESIRLLQQGDHFLGEIEGQWLNVEGLGWIEASQITTKPVGYLEIANNWN